MAELQIPKYPRDSDGRPLDLLAAVTVDLTGNGGGQFPSSVTGPDRMPIDKVGLVILDQSGNLVDLSAAGGMISASVAFVNDKTALASAPLTLGKIYLLSNPGWWVLTNKVGNTAAIARDTYQGLWVPSTIDTNKVWKRIWEGPLQASWFDVTDGQPDNAARIENMQGVLSSDTGRGAWIQLPYGDLNIDRSIGLNRPNIIQGYGAAKGMSGGSGSTRLLFPAGSNGFDIAVGGQQTKLRDFKMYTLGVLTTIGTANYAPGTSTTTITGCTLLDITNNQTIQLEGAGTSLVIPGRTAAMGVGSNVATLTDTDGYHGNAVGYIGQMIEIAGAGAAGAALIGYIGSWGVGTVNIVDAAGAALNASTAVTAAVITVRAPHIAKVIGGGGTATLTIDTYTDNPQAVTGAKIRHAATGIYSVIQCHASDLEIDGFQIGMALCGDTVAGAVADLCSGYNIMFGTGRIGLALQGTDAQVNAFYLCNFAGSEIGILDNSFLGNDFVNIHMAYNVGIVVYRQGAVSKVMGGYAETGTAYYAPDSGASTFWATVGMANGSGFQGVESGSGRLTVGRFKANKPVELAKGAFIGGGANMTRIQPGQTVPTDMTRVGSGIEMIFDGTRHWWYGLTQGGGNDKPWRLDALGLEFAYNAAVIANITTNGFNMASGKNIYMNNTQVLTSQRTGWTAATGTPSRGAFAAAAAGTVSAAYVQAEAQASRDRIAALEARLIALEADIRTHGLIN
jgi:hypothetical protein